MEDSGKASVAYEPVTKENNHSTEPGFEFGHHDSESQYQANESENPASENAQPTDSITKRGELVTGPDLTVGGSQKQVEHPPQPAEQDQHRENGAPRVVMSTVQPKKGEDCQDPLHGVRIDVVRGDTDHRHQ